MRRLRISAISYLNTAPLMWDFEHGEAGRSFDISYTLPSACARSLQAGTADIGIIPAAAYAQIPGLEVLPGVAIASRRAVRSILLVSKVPIEKTRTIALDTSSMTSVALTKILFEKWWGGGRTFSAMSPNLDEMLATNDAGLLIGDPALQVDRSRYLTLDLAEEWIRYTGKPFVFAFWAVRQQALQEAGWSGESRPRQSAARSDARVPAQDLAQIFQDSRDHGLAPSSLPRMGAAPRPPRRRSLPLSHRKHPLRTRSRLHRRLAIFLPLRRRNRRPARRARAVFPKHRKRSNGLAHECSNCFASRRFRSPCHPSAQPRPKPQPTRPPPPAVTTLLGFSSAL